MTPRLSEAARHLVIPEGIVTSVWPRVRRRLATVDVQFDPWQDGFAMAALGCREDGRYAAEIGGVVESIPRQVGKTYKDGSIAIGLAAEFPGFRAAWTSHHNRTTTNTFRKMQGMVTRKKMRGLLAPNGIRTANGEQEIRFANGSIIMFGAREQGFGRGLDEMDLLVFDETQILSIKALEDMVPSTNQAQNPHGGLVFFLGTPPRPTDDGEAFAAMRRNALSGGSKNQMFVEFSADPDARWDDREQWRKANPSYPHRTSEAAMLRMHELIPDEDSWRREAMGIWDEEDGERWLLWPRSSWQACAAKVDGDAPWIVGPVTLGIEMPPDGSRVNIAAAGDTADGGWGFDVVRCALGTSWVVGEVQQMLADKAHPVSSVVIDPKSPAGKLLVPQFEAAKVKVHETTYAEVTEATAELYDAVVNGLASHRDRPDLNAAVAGAARRTNTEGVWLIERRGDVDSSPIGACNLAMWGHRHLTATAKPRVWNLNAYVSEEDD